MSRLFLLCLIALLPLAARGQAADDARLAALEAGLEIEEAPALELVIVGPGEEDFTLYGHAAMRVIDDPEHPETARVFNFGITDFDNERLERDFIGGRVEFWGNQTAYARTLEGWEREDRTVVRYPIQLGDGARRRLLARMEHDVELEHRLYIYDTFRENCATRLRDYLDTYSNGTVFATHGAVMTDRRFRDDVRHAYSRRTTLLMATELMAGSDTDRVRSVWDLMYRPEYMAERLAEVVLPGGTSLLGTPVVDHQRQGADPRDGAPQHGQIVWLIFAAIVAVVGWWLPGFGPRVRGGVLAGTVVLSTLIGVVMLAVGLTTAWPELQRNPSVFVFIPLDLLLLWTAGRLLVTERSGEAPLARMWLRGRLVVGLVVVALTPVVGVLQGPLPPRLFGLALVFLALRCLDQADDRTQEYAVVDHDFDRR